MNHKIRILFICGLLIILSLSIIGLGKAYGYNFVYPAARRSAISGYTYGDPPNHLAWDYRFPKYTDVSAAQNGWIATSSFIYNDDHEPLCIEDRLENRGNYIVLNHTSDDRTEYTGLETWYFHLSRTGNQPVPGNYFAVGQEMAYSGDTGCGGAHLHFASKNNGTPFDPYAGSTHWVSGQPIPMGYRDQNGAVQGPFALDNEKIRDEWIALEGAPGAPVNYLISDYCNTINMQAAPFFLQEFEKGYIEYCGSSDAQYVEYGFLTVPDLKGRFTCGAGDNSILEISNPNPFMIFLSVQIYDNYGRTIDSRVYSSLPPGSTWIVNIHHIVFDWLNRERGAGGIFNGYARIYKNTSSSIGVSHFYTLDRGCVFYPAILSP